MMSFPYQIIIFEKIYFHLQIQVNKLMQFFFILRYCKIRNNIFFGISLDQM